MPESNPSDHRGTSRRRLLQSCAVVVGAGLLGAHGTLSAAAAPPEGGMEGSGAGADGAPPAPGTPPGRSTSAVPDGGTSYNGWSVGTPGSVIGIQNYTVPGTSVVLPIRSGDVATVLVYVAQRFNAEVETLDRSQCGGYDYRANVNNPSVWSNHASGTAIDLNAVIHYNGGKSTFTATETAAVRRILAFCGDVVYWGQDYRGVVDGMHFEINVPPGDSRLTRLVAKIRGGAAPAVVNVPGIDSFRDSGGTQRVFGIAPGGRLIELSRPAGGSWRAGDASNGGYVLGTPAVNYGGGRADVFAIGGDGAGWSQFRSDSGGWSGWRRMGGANLVGGLASVIGTGGIPHVFAITSGGGLWQYFGSWEGGWALQDVSNGGVLRGSPAAVYRNGRYDVFGIGTDGAVWQQTYTDGSPAWIGWRRVGGNDLNGGLGVARLANGSFRVVAIDTGGGLQMFSSTTGSSWTARDITNGGVVTGTPSILAGANRLDVFAVGMDRQVWQEGSVNSGSWSDWQPIGGTIG